MVVGKIISIFDISIEVILSEMSVKIGDILSVKDDPSYSFEVVSINNVSATCISLGTTRGLKKGLVVEKTHNGIEIEYSDKILGRVFNSYGEPMDDLNLEFIAIMPNDIDEYIENISKKKIDEISSKFVNASEKTKLKLSIPKFKFDYRLDLENDLKELGVNKIFTPEADLSGIGNDLYVSSVVHKATIDLKEKGVKASATTAIVVSKNSAVLDESEYVIIDFNKPFIFIIKDKKTDDVWFVGTIMKLGDIEEQEELEENTQDVE